MAEVLVVEDEANARQVLALILEGHGHGVAACANAAEAEVALKQGRFDVVLTDLRMEGRNEGLDVVRMGARLCPDTPIILLTAYASAQTAVEAMKEGAFDYLTKPVSSEELAQAVERALDAGSGASNHVADESGMDEVLSGISPAMQRVRERLRRAGQRDFTVLITGESGTGKELAAHYLHQHSARASGPFVPVHCGAIPSELFESELFGHKRGSFTGATADRQGMIESAQGGTLFLDEIGEMPISIQVKLLRVLQDMKVRPVGSDREVPVDVRVVAATNRDLAEEVSLGNFREDLYYRLHVVPVHMPPLRARREDIPVLVERMLAKWGDEKVSMTPECLQRMTTMPFMGNVRELENVIQRLLAMADGDGELNVSLLEDIYQPGAGSPADMVSLEVLQKRGAGLDDFLADIERILISQALDASGGNATRAADLLGISFRSMRYRLDKLGFKDMDGE
jgi:two-component system, NtrC family, response regulator PilR